MIIGIKIGAISRQYEVFATTAPRQYDGFGTLTLLEDCSQRVVLISQKDWQINRYASGMHSCQPIENSDYDFADIDRISQSLWEKAIDETMGAGLQNTKGATTR